MESSAFDNLALLSSTDWTDNFSVTILRKWSQSTNSEASDGMKLALLALGAISLVDGYRIFCVFPVPTASHNILGKGIVDALLGAEHHVWWATPYPEQAKPRANLTIIDVSATQVVFENLNTTDAASMMDFRRGIDISAIAAAAPEVQQAMVQLDFDAVVTEWFVSDLPAGYAAVQQVPWIMLSSTAAHPILESLVDDVTSTPLLPTIMNKAPLPMNFWQRVANSLLVGGMKIISWGLRVYTSGLYEERFGPLAAARGVPLPPLSAVYNNISVLLVNSHPTVAPAQSFPPNVVDIAGYHMEDQNAALPENLQKLLDSSTQGFVYFSLGSVVRVSQLSAALKKELVQVFSELPYLVLWRSDEELTGLPDNVHARKWFPQAVVLAHRNIKLFITHGGLLSTIEAIHYGVPLLAVPVFGDQPGNAAHAAAAGFAVQVPFHGGMARELRDALAEMVNNDSYYKTAKHLSKLFHSRPVPPSKLIAHYVELAIESKGAYHLRSPARHYAWYQRARLDQMLCCAVFFYSLYVAGRLVTRQLRRITGKRKKE